MIPALSGPAASGIAPHAVESRDITRLRAAAEQLEAGFLAEMLKAAGLDRPVEQGFGGGEGEQHFASFLVDAQAQALVRAGGIGLAESLFEALKGRAAHA